MQEIELKFLVPEARLKGLMRQVKVKSSQSTQMAAHYFDTPKQELAQKGIGLRIRQEGDNWVQTIKAGGDGIALRLEHNALLDTEQVQAMLSNNALLPDLSIYEDTSIAPTLADFNLKKLTKKLTRLYVTDVERTTRLLEEQSGEEKNAEADDSKNMLELAYDQGRIIHGDDDSLFKPIHEIEFELVLGDLDYLFATAKTWCKRYKLYLSTVTKAERGGLLINKQAHSPALKADLQGLILEQDISMPAFVRAVVHNCLLQILANSSAIVEGSMDNEHILQLRIGIQRLRAALKAFSKFSEQINPEWLSILKQTASLLGDYRDLAQLAHTVQPKLEQQGAPKVDWNDALNQVQVSPIDAVRANDFQLTLLELIAFIMSDANSDVHADKLAADKLAKILAKHYAKLIKAEQKLADFDIDNANQDRTAVKDNGIGNESLNLRYDLEHKVRRRLKDLHYISEFAAPLYSDQGDNKKEKKENKKQVKRWLKRLNKAQKALGQHLETMQYQQRYQQKAATDTNALYGAGWFAASLKGAEKKRHKRLRKLHSGSPYW